jgi:uncharacterized protein
MITLDTNILIHAHHAETSLHDAAKIVVQELAESPATWGICYHSLVEFYGVVTQPKIWRCASTPEQAMNQIWAWRESPSLRLLYDSDASMELLEALTLAGKIRGSLVHDARIAACCLSHGIRELWTVDRNFSRFPKLKTRNPLF